jgi:hypothetical protein
MRQLVDLCKTKEPRAPLQHADAFALATGANSATPQQQQQQQAAASCQAQSSFVVWPMAERGSGIERRSSLQLPQQQPGQPNAAAAAGAAGAASAAAATAAAAAASGAADVSLQDTDMIDYKLGMQVSKLRWEVRCVLSWPFFFPSAWTLF